jgi:hypothetical protein
VGPLGGKGRQLVGKVGEWYVASRYLQGCSHHLCRLRADELAPVSKYWTYRSHTGDMGPISLVAYCRQMFGLSALLQWLCWERNWGGSHGPLSWAKRWSREQFFLGVVNLSNSIGSVWKVSTYRDRPQEAYAGHTWTDVGSVRVVLVGFSPVWCTSIRIAATLGYE